MVDDLFDVSRISTGKLWRERRVVEMVGIIDEAADNLAHNLANALHGPLFGATVFAVERTLLQRHLVLDKTGATSFNIFLTDSRSLRAGRRLQVRDFHLPRASILVHADVLVTIDVSIRA